jgi:membrane associated rhomboid family serine protease
VFPLKDNIPTDRTPVVTIALILANVLVFFLFQKARITVGGSGVDQVNAIHYGAIPYEFTHPGKMCDVLRDAAGHVTGSVVCQPLPPGVSGKPDPQPTYLFTAFTSMFMHGGLLHIFGNMLFLWIFGNNVEDSMGRVRFLAFYVLGGLAALAGQILVSPNAMVPTIGASGAVAGVLGGYILLYPRARVLTVVFIILFFTVIELPAIFFLGIWFLEQIWFGTLDLTNPTGGGGGVAYFAHVGGFVFGLLAIKAFAQRHKTVGGRFPVY